MKGACEVGRSYIGMMSCPTVWSGSIVLSLVLRSENKLRTNLHRGDQPYHPSGLFYASNLEAKMWSSAVWLGRVG